MGLGGAQALQVLGATPAWGAKELHTFRFLLLLHATVRIWDWTRIGPSSAPLWITLLGLSFGVPMLVACWMATSRRRGVWAARLACLVVAIELAASFPAAANHIYLEFCCLLILSFFDPFDNGERVLATGALRWIGLAVLFYAGLQKLAYGYYFQGEFLLFAMTQREPFAEFFTFFLPANELQRFSALGALAIGDGPFRSGSWLLVVLSNGIWIAEITLAVLLLFKRTRTAAATAAIAVVILLQVPAREVMFALLFTLLLVLHLGGNWVRRLAPAYAVAYAYIVGYMAGLFPGEFLTRAGSL